MIPMIFVMFVVNNISYGFNNATNSTSMKYNESHSLIIMWSAIFGGIIIGIILILCYGLYRGWAYLSLTKEVPRITKKSVISPHEYSRICSDVSYVRMMDNSHIQDIIPTTSIEAVIGWNALDTLEIQCENDKIVASEWQKDMFDFKNITSGRVHIKQIITGNNNNKDDIIQIENDRLIAMNISKNQNEIYVFTDGKMDPNNWFTKK